MKKRLLGILLSFALMLTMMPVLGLSLTAYAATETYTNLIPTSSDTDLTSKQVTFNGYKWYIIEDNSTAVNAGTVTLLSKECFGNHVFNSDLLAGNVYANSEIKTYVDGLTGTGQPLAGTSSVISDLTLIDKATAQELPVNVLKCSQAEGADDNAWWLCSQGCEEYYGVVVFGENGEIGDQALVTAKGGVRPALKLDLSKVAFDTTSNTFSIQSYPLWVGETQVTSANAGDILGNHKASYVAESNTLTLNGAKITKGHRVDYGEYGDSESGIYYNGSEPLNIVLSDDSVNTVAIAGRADSNLGIYVDENNEQSSGLNISGKGQLTVSGSDYGIYAPKDITIDGCDVTAISTGTGESYYYAGIHSYRGSIEIKGGSVNASATNGNANAIGAYYDVTIEGASTVTATGNNSGIKAGEDIVVNGGSITATGALGTGISANRIAKFNSGTIEAAGYQGGEAYSSGVSVAAAGGCGISAGDCVEINEGVASLTASGADGAISGYEGKVKNAIAGTGWTDVAGTAGKNAIAINKEGQDLTEYRKVQFPAKVDPEPTPAPAPASPLTVTTTAKPSAKSMTVKWTWNSVAGAKSYKVSYHKVGSKKWTTKTTKKTKYVVKGHKFRGLYEYKVAAVTASGDVWSDVNCRYFKRVKATAKAGKTAGTVKASWKKDKGATGYKVLLATNKKMNNAQAVEVSADQKSYTFSGLKSGKKYYVKVRPLKNYNGVTYQGIYTKALRAKTK